MSAIHHIPQKVRAEYADRIVLAYELIGERKQAVEAVRDLPPAHPTLTYIKSDPDLGALLRDPALGKVR